ncbi:hypothetical protein [Streptomyces chattanoogensis]|uniref:hypothetical protein n=1 Tax=Streptomyces chattanoogensis TaxID=66876 RepID=UPI0005D863B0|nr:hypothetical protein T261_3445 [Streptomyces lydicus]
MARKKPNDALRALLTEAGWSAADLARAVNALGTGSGLRLRYDRTSVAHWLDGARPRGAAADLVAQALSRRIGRPLTQRDAGLDKPEEGGNPVEDMLQATDPLQRLSSLCRMDSDPARRVPLTRAVLPAALPAPWEKRPAWTPPRTGHGSPATEADVARLGDMACWIAPATERHGGAHTRSTLAHYIAEEVSRLLAAPAAPMVRKGLLSGAAQLTQLLATMTADVGFSGLAQHYYGIGLELAHAAGDRATYAVTLRSMSVQAHRLGDRHRALTLAEAALDTAGSAVPPATRAFLHAGRAVGYAAVGRSGMAHADLSAAEEALGRSTEPEGPFTSYSYAALQYQRAEVLALLGDHKKAVAALESSLHHRPAGHRKARALIHAQTAHVLLAAEQRDAALVQCHRFLDDYGQLAAGSAHGALTRILRELSPYRSNPGVRDFRARLRAVSSPAHGTEEPPPRR